MDILTTLSSLTSLISDISLTLTAPQSIVLPIPSVRLSADIVVFLSKRLHISSVFLPHGKGMNVVFFSASAVIKFKRNSIRHRRC